MGAQGTTGHQWYKQIEDERILKEIQFSRLYVKQFGHGTPGHLHHRAIAQLADLLDQQEERDMNFLDTLVDLGTESTP